MSISSIKSTPVFKMLSLKCLKALKNAFLQKSTEPHPFPWLIAWAGADATPCFHPLTGRQLTKRFLWVRGEGQALKPCDCWDVVKNWGVLNFFRKAHHSGRKGRERQKEEKDYQANFTDTHKENKVLFFSYSWLHYIKYLVFFTIKQSQLLGLREAIK